MVSAMTQPAIRVLNLATEATNAVRDISSQVRMSLI